MNSRAPMCPEGVPSDELRADDEITHVRYHPALRRAVLAPGQQMHMIRRWSFHVNSLDIYMSGHVFWLGTRLYRAGPDRICRAQRHRRAHCASSITTAGSTTSQSKIGVETIALLRKMSLLVVLHRFQSHQCATGRWRSAALATF